MHVHKPSFRWQSLLSFGFLWAFLVAAAHAELALERVETSRRGATQLDISLILSGPAPEPIDIESRVPVIGNNQGGLSGPAIKPVALLKVHQVYQVCKPHNIPIIGQGGVSCAEDALEFLIAGASAVGVGTALFYDPLICSKINQGISDYLVQHRLSSITELTGSLQLNSSSYC